eukprot:SAG31_NODE_259_length_18917_cov_28.559677_19_plen_173_part_00
MRLTDWSMSGRAECFEELYDGGYEESDAGSTFDASYGVRGADEPVPEMETCYQQIGSWSKLVATPEQRALEKFKVRTTDNEQKREIQQKRQGRPVMLDTTGPLVLDTSRSSLYTDRSTGNCTKRGDPYRRGHVQRLVAGRPSDCGPLNKLRRQATGDTGWILDGEAGSQHAK